MHQELESASKEGTVDIWLEFISDLWQKHLPHLREELFGEGLFVYNPNTGCYGFQEEEEEEGEEMSSNALMAALLKEAAEEDWEEGGRQADDSFKLQPPSMEEESSYAVISGVPGHTYDLNQPSSDEEEETGPPDIVVEGAGPEDGGEEPEEGAKKPEASILPDDCETYLLALLLVILLGPIILS